MDSSNETINEQSSTDNLRKDVTVQGLQDENDATWKQFISEYELDKEIGQGSFGKVFLATHIKTQKKVAIKMMKKLFENEYDSKRLLCEIQILHKLSQIPHNQFTPKIYDIITPAFDVDSDQPVPYLLIVMEYVSTDLKKVLNDADKIGLDHDHIVTILYNSLCCLNYIHSAGLIHRDIKSANILMDDECRAKICDFGLARTKVNSPYDDMEIYVKSRMVPLTPKSHLAKHPAMFNSAEKKFMTRRNGRTRSTNRTLMQMAQKAAQQTYFTKSDPEGGYNSNSFNSPSHSPFNSTMKQLKIRNNAYLSPNISSPKYTNREQLNQKNSILRLSQSLKMNINQDQKSTRRQIISDRLIEDRPNRQSRVRDLSNHVVSRWYRPPEIILLEKTYDQAVDIWSLGCVLAEMIYCTYYESQGSNDRVLFPGKSCYPLSPQSNAKQSNQVSKHDQLRKILESVGPLKEHDMSFVTDALAIDYLNQLNQNQSSQEGYFTKMFPQIDSDMLELLQAMLEFNPYLRITAKDALKSRIFDKIRQPYYEQPCPVKIKLDIIDLDDYDYKTTWKGKFGIPNFKLMMQAEIQKIKKGSELVQQKRAKSRGHQRRVSKFRHSIHQLQN